jgi:hypothetical protein
LAKYAQIKRNARCCALFFRNLKLLYQPAIKPGMSPNESFLTLSEKTLAVEE